MKKYCVPKLGPFDNLLNQTEKPTEAHAALLETRRRILKKIMSALQKQVSKTVTN
jgi:hypothetical protein